MDWIDKRVGEKNAPRLCVLKVVGPRYYAHRRHALLGVLKPVTVWKKVQITGGYRWDDWMVIPLILLPDTRLWVHQTENKCRANFAIAGKFKVPKDAVMRSHFDYGFEYHPGMAVIPDRFNTRSSVCAGGVHFFFRRFEASRYNI